MLLVPVAFQYNILSLEVIIIEGDCKIKPSKRKTVNISIKILHVIEMGFLLVCYKFFSCFFIFLVETIFE